jgi:hypothetical protein
MNFSDLVAAVAAIGFPCTDPGLQDFAAHELPWPAAYVRSVEGLNIIAVREDVREDERRLQRVLVHELLHCGLYEERERRGQPHPPSLDQREELAVHSMTDAVLERLTRS